MKSWVVVLCVFMISCGKKDPVPAAYIQPAKMQLVLWDFLRADALTIQRLKAFGSPESAVDNIPLQKQVFAIHHVTKEDFYESLAFYEANPHIMKTLLDSVAERATRERANNVPLNPVIPQVEK